MPTLRNGSQLVAQGGMRETVSPAETEGGIQMSTDALDQANQGLIGLFAGTYGLVAIIWVVIVIAAMWMIFSKAGQPGWAAIVPIYNYYVLLKVVGRPGWWLILLFIPLVNFVIALIVTYDLAKVFGKGMGYFLGLLFLGFIFYPMLAFGSAQYQGKSS